MHSTLVRNFATLFLGRHDAYGTDTGGCIRVQPGSTSDLAIWWDELWDAHLNEPGCALGIYPVRPDNTVRWGCVDIDVGNKPGALYETWHDAWDHSLVLHSVLRELGITAWIEQTRSQGAHVWVFASEPVPARTMRRALLAAHQIADLPQKEVNPKQETLAEGKLGNYVRVPYPHLAERQHVLATNGTKLPCELFVNNAFDTRTAPNVLEQAADLHQTPTAPPVASTSFDAGRIVNRSQYAATLIEQGPFNKDRSAFLWLLARTMCEADIPFSDAWAALCVADQRWGKFHEKNQVEHLYHLLEKAYA